MLDINMYRNLEEKAKSCAYEYNSIRKYNLDIFEKHGFPVRINTFQGLFSLLDSMQENRKSFYINDILLAGGGGFSSMYNSLVDACKKSLELQEVYFQNKRHFLPLEILSSSCVVYHRLKSIKPNFENIFEIGPGSSGMSYFLSQHESLKDYSYTDACESFYMLQNLVNTHCFSGEFKNFALDFVEDSFYDPETKSKAISTRQKREFIESKQNIKVNAYPWWKINEIQNKKKHFDIMLSNANLQEFSSDCLHDYLLLTKDILKDDGILYANCLGLVSNNTPESLFSMIYELGFAIYFYYSFNNIFYANLEKLDFLKNEAIVLAPACESAKFLLEDLSFVDKFSEIYLLDDFKVGEICGKKIINTKELEFLGIKNIVFIDDKLDLKERFKSKFKNFNFIALDCRRAIVPSLCLIKDTHKDYKKYKDRQVNFYKMPCGVDSIDCLYTGVFDCDRFDVLEKLKNDIKKE